MQMHAATWGHVGLTTCATAAMESAEEQSEIAMLRCRYGIRKTRPKRASLSGFFPNTAEVILNPNTLQDLADIFETRIELAFR